jgi:hypothetical protein
MNLSEVYKRPVTIRNTRKMDVIYIGFQAIDFLEVFNCRPLKSDI